MARLTVVVLNLKPQILNSGPGDIDLERYAKSIVDALSDGPSANPIQWLQTCRRSIKVASAPALLAFAAYLVRNDVNAVIDKAQFELSPDEREKARQFLARLNPPGPEKMQEELLRLSDYLYLKELEYREGNPIVILPTRPTGHPKRLEEFRIIELDFLDDPVDTYRRGIGSVPFQVRVKFNELTRYNTEEVLIKFWHQSQQVFAVMKRHLLHLFDSGLKPKSRSRPRLELISARLDECRLDQLHGNLPLRELSLLSEVQSINNQLKSLRDYLTEAAQVFIVPVTQVVNETPYMQVGRPPNQRCVYLVNPSPTTAAIDLQIEYLSEEGRVIELFELESLRANESKELDSDFIIDLRAQGAASLRLRQTGQTLHLP